MTPFDWQRVLLNDLPLWLLIEIAARVVFGYFLVFFFLRASGRRGVRQLSLFELVVILTLGSAAGDVILYEDVPVLFTVVVFAIILILYRTTTYFLQNSPKIAAWVEGKPTTLIRNGLYELDTFQHLNITDDEFFMELRQQSVEHLGQVRLAILEVDGELSLYFYEQGSVKPGLSVLPPEHREVYKKVPADALYACSCCGVTQALSSQQSATCPRCENILWSKALTTERQV